jgi:hypothetical protein
VYAVEISHQRGIFMRRPGDDLFFHVIGEEGVKHGLPLSGSVGGLASGRSWGTGSDILFMASERVALDVTRNRRHTPRKRAIQHAAAFPFSH